MHEISVLNVYNTELHNAKLLPVLVICLEFIFNTTSSVISMASHCEFSS
jgi:hypothetical protein